MTETRVTQPFVSSPLSSSDQSHQQFTIAVETTPLLSGETSEHSHTSTYHTALETLPVHPPCPPTSPYPRNPSPSLDSLPSYDTAQRVLTGVINLHSKPPQYLSSDVE